jgi:Uma2 family endonuclease
MASSSREGGMSQERITTDEYLSGPETISHRELVWGFVQEPPSALLTHQAVVMHVSTQMAMHVWDRKIGKVYGAPLDVILDHDRALVLQPDVMYVSNERRDILGKWIHGAPDIAVEVESPATRRYDRVSKLKWYRQYGVREYWLMDPEHWTVTIINLEGARISRQVFDRADVIVSTVLPDFRVQAGVFFDPTS